MEAKRVHWTELEVHFMLTIIRDKNIVDMLDGKRHRNTDIFKIVEEELKKRGYLKSVVQIRTKWKALKLRYYKMKRANLVSGSDRKECQFWEELEEILGHRPSCNVEGVESSSSLGLNETEAEGDGNTTPEVVLLESEPTADSSKEQQSEREQGPVRKKNKVERRGYCEALKAFSKDIKESQREIANMFLEKQAEMFTEERKELKQWDRELLEEDRMKTERMLTHLMSSFFQNIGLACQQPDQFRFFNPSQALVPNSVPVPFISPVTPTINIPPPQAPLNSNYVSLPYPSPEAPTNNFRRPQTPNPNYAPLSLPVSFNNNCPRSQAPSNSNCVPLSYHTPESSTNNIPRPKESSNPNYAPLLYPSPEFPSNNLSRPHTPSNPNYTPLPYPSPESPSNNFSRPQTPNPNYAPFPYPLPVSFTNNIPRPQGPLNPNYVPLPSSLFVSSTNNLPRPQTPSNPNYAPLPYSLPVSSTNNFPRPQTPNPNYVPLPYPSPESPTIPFPPLVSNSETQFSTQADGSGTPQRK